MRKALEPSLRSHLMELALARNDQWDKIIAEGSQVLKRRADFLCGFNALNFMALKRH
jgi:hypothetical protein